MFTAVNPSIALSLVKVGVKNAIVKFPKQAPVL
jgi:hypothetical protein